MNIRINQGTRPLDPIGKLLSPGIEVGTRLSRDCTNDVRLSLGNCNSSGKCLGAEELARSLEQRYKRGQDAFDYSVKRCVIGEGKSAYLLGHRT